MKKTLPLVLLLIVGCSANTEPEARKQATSLDNLQGKWKVIEATDPNGTGFEASGIVVTITGDKAVSSQGGTLRLEFNADGSYLKILAVTDQGEKQVGECAVYVTTTEQPVKMLWSERNSRQTTLYERLP